MSHKYLICLMLFVAVSSSAQDRLHTEVLVIGGGTGGTAAGIQSARCGVQTIVVEATPWLGGMLSAAGVTATDGNDSLYSGLWQEFRKALYQHYGTSNLITGWVSNTQFEPHVADSIFKAMAAKEKLLQVKYRWQFKDIIKSGNKVNGAIFKDKDGKLLTVFAKIIIDATELGDALAKAGAAYDVGLENNDITHENLGITATGNIIQDLTYAAILKDYGTGTDKTIGKPEGYDPKEFDGACTNYYHDTTIEKPVVDATAMLNYAKLPNGKYMINWPKHGNDTYLNVIEMSDEQRAKALKKAKLTTLRFIYFIQHELGFKNLGIANDEFSTPDGLPYIPYYREGRRVRGEVRFTVGNISKPFTFGDPLYRTGIAVGDYPIDHHHKKNSIAPQHLYFYPIPSFNVPLGCLVPNGVDNFIVADKSISVSNVVNGTTRLQPCVLLTGQAAGILAALSIQQVIQPALVSVRNVQKELLKSKAYIMPYIDVRPSNKNFDALQRIGATGILKGKGIPYLWANQTWFYPDSICTTTVLLNGFQEYLQGWKAISNIPADKNVTVENLCGLISNIIVNNHIEISKAGLTNDRNNTAGILDDVQQHWQQWHLENFSRKRSLIREEVAVVLDHVLNPFSLREVDYKGYFKY
jgi:hypothetical protein